jgi:hypothetical protein
MTLILSCATAKYVVQVSDRRLTWTRGPNAGRVADDRSNKAVVFCDRMSFAYTGLAEIGGIKTYDWIGKTIADPTSNTVSGACRKLETAATAAFRGLRAAPEDKRHAFCGVGWVLIAPEPVYRACVCSISNAQDDNFQWLPRAEGKFTLRYRVLSATEPLLFLDTGHPLPSSYKNYLVRHLRRAVEHDVRAPSIAWTLLHAVRAISDHAPSVGKDVMVVTLPKTEGSCFG